MIFIDTFYGAASVCIQNSKVLMVLQGGKEENKTWSVPTGGKENNETFSNCCLRELEEETGYKGKVLKELFVKNGVYEHLDLNYEVHYYEVKIIGGTPTIQDPDMLIYGTAWKSYQEIENLHLTYPEDRDTILTLLKKSVISQN